MRAQVCLLAILVIPVMFASAQQSAAPSDSEIPSVHPFANDSFHARIHGVVVDKDGTVYEGAQVALSSVGGDGTAPGPVRTSTTDSNGQFNFSDVPPGAFTISITSNGFATQTVTGILHAGETFDARSIVLAMSASSSEIEVTATQTEIALEELKQEETQRVLGVIPNFYVTYVPNAPPLTTKQKYSLAWKSSVDPVTFLAVGFFAGIEQATNTFSGYGQGAEGYAKRYGAGFADSFIGTLIGGAILPAWWKQDPRYFYKGTGTTRSRALYAIANAVVCKGDNGHWQANYSAIVGGLAAGGISNLYYPAANRNGAELTFENALVDTGFSAAGNLFQEFVVRKLTPKIPNYSAGKP
jgi:Carboxypeptidase regulatory-like domain